MNKGGWVVASSRSPGAAPLGSTIAGSPQSLARVVPVCVSAPGRQGETRERVWQAASKQTSKKQPELQNVCVAGLGCMGHDMYK